MQRWPTANSCRLINQTAASPAAMAPTVTNPQARRKCNLVAPARQKVSALSSTAYKANAGTLTERPRTFDQRLCNTKLQSKAAPDPQPATSSERKALRARYPVTPSAAQHSRRIDQVKRGESGPTPPPAGSSSDSGHRCLNDSNVAAMRTPRNRSVDRQFSPRPIQRRPHQDYPLLFFARVCRKGTGQ